MRFRKIVKVCVFFAIGILIFQILQCILVPKRFPYTKSYDAGKLAAYYAEEKNSIDVLICGTSHASKGILPMEIYEKYGIKSYNLSTSVQPIEATYYLLSEALKTQKPSVFIYDVSNLYINSVEKYHWLYVMDEMHFGINKIAFAKEYRKSAKNSEESTKELLFPLLAYHTRWKELGKEDFTVFLRDRHYFGKGGQINSAVSPAEMSVEEMNAAEDELLLDTEKTEYVYDGEEARTTKEKDILYQSGIPEKNIEWLHKIKTLCEENGVSFLAVKVPAVYMPQDYRTAWTVGKYRAVKSLCEEQGIPYYDILYDSNAVFDYRTDTPDNGTHLNLLGAQKASGELGNYLKEHYELSGEQNEQWDKDLMSYQKVRKVARLQVERDFFAYMDMLAKEYNDTTIFICVAGDMGKALNEDEIRAFRALGLQADFENAFQKSYIAVIEKGELKYEALSNRSLSYGGICSGSGTDYGLYSSGWWSAPMATISLAGNELVRNKEQGINIVVYDDERKLVIDNVCFILGTDYQASKKNGEINDFEVSFEEYLIEEEKQ